VKSIGVNPVDTYIRSGTHLIKPQLPYIPGGDGAGIVEEIGESVSKLKVMNTIHSMNIHKYQTSDHKTKCSANPK